MFDRIHHYFALAIILIVASCIGGCSASPAPSYPRHIARGAVLSVAYAVTVADNLCSETARGIADVTADDEEPDDPDPSKVIHIGNPSRLNEAIALAKACQRGYDIARSALLASADAVDAWGSATDGDVACAIGEAVSGLRMIVTALRSAGVEKLPAAVGDAFAAADWVVSVIGGQCAMPRGGVKT